ncbi:MAG: hypothetical protein GTO63_10810, partial [Anaerolineae bacterium]|nr:hypothetical protein [Anaerolineae bacterium]NIN95373.1 hypothetical protein [Anaerolineae bacterium]
MGWRRAAVIGLFALMIGLAFVHVGSDVARAQVGAKTITVDGDPSDWTGVNNNPNTGVVDAFEYIWNDSVGDDTGDGDYTYPYSGDLNRTGLFDIQELRITADAQKLYILIKIVNLSNTWSGSDGFSTVAAILLIDTTLDGSGTLAARPNVNVAAGSGWEYWAKIGQTGWHAENAKVFDEAGNWAPIVNKGNSTQNSIEASIPLAFIGKDGYSINNATWRFMFFLHSFDGGGPNGFRDVRAGQWCCEWQFGGGEDHGFDPQITDLAFNASQAQQEAELASYTSSSPATIASHADVTFGNVGFVPDTTSPTISGVVASPTFNSANIDWSTDEIADTTVIWGTSPGSLTNIASKNEFVTSHSVTLTSLLAQTTYYYRASSYDIAANGARTSVLSFTTAAAPPSNIAAWVGSTFTWQDSAGDDVGDGDYTYPQTGLVDWFGRADLT